MKRKQRLEKSCADESQNPRFSPASNDPDAVIARRDLRIIIEYVRTADLTCAGPELRNSNPDHIALIASNIRQFGFLMPLITKGNRIWVGAKRKQAAEQLGIPEVPVIRAEHLSEAELRVCRIADNRLAELSTWNQRALGEEFQALSKLNLDFSLEFTGFEAPEIDHHIQLASDPLDDGEDLSALNSKPAVTRLGDLWQLERHRAFCANSLSPDNHQLLFGGERASAVFSDPPWNLPTATISGLGRTKHRDFAMASGEMSKAEFVEFLAKGVDAFRPVLKAGAVVFLCMDWRHVAEVCLAVDKVGGEVINICVWVKHNAGMGNWWRGQHEFVFVIGIQGEKHMNCVQLGRFGRHRSNVWSYKGANDFSRGDGEGDLLALHPCPKPVALVGDAMMDCTRRGDIVLDNFFGSGTSVIAAERTGRVCYGIELDPVYVDSTVLRWQRLTGQKARHVGSGLTFEELQEQRSRESLPRKRAAQRR